MSPTKRTHFARAQAADEAAIVLPAKKRKRAARKKHPEQDDHLDLESSLDSSFARLDPQLLADYLARMTVRFGTDLSPVELSDLALPASSIRDTTEYSSPRTLENLPSFIEKFTARPETLRAAPVKNGSPHTLVVTGAALRAADIVRAMRTFSSKDVCVAKLFAKHMKLEEQADFLRTSRTCVCVGTPARLTQLINNGSLSVEELERIVVDASHIDQKKRGILSMRDTMLPLAHFFVLPKMKSGYTRHERPLDLLFF